MDNPQKTADPNVREENSVKTMFSRIAPFYDFINRAMTFGLDVLWRRRLVAELGLPQGASVVADIACGSGDVALEIVRRNPQCLVKGVDFCPSMLEISRAKFAKKSLAERAEFIEADCESLPFADCFFDGATISFGFRNFRDRQKCLAEISRVLKPDAKLCILEVNRASGVFAKIQKVFMAKFVPSIASLCGGKREDYAYLAETTLSYPPSAQIEEMFRKAGFKNVSTRPMGFGLVAVTAGEKK